MSINTTLAGLSTNPALNGPDGSSDLPSQYDDAIRYALSFIALIRDGAGVQPGLVCNFATTTPPLGFLKMNGQLVSRTTYATLFAFASASGLVSEAAWTAGSFGCFSVGDGSTTFRLPDLRAKFLRGLDESRGIDTSRVFGVDQAAANVLHTHVVTDPTHVHAVSDPTHNHGGTTTTAGSHAHSYAGWAATGGGAGVGAFPVYQPAADITSVDPGHAHNVVTDFRGTGISLFAASTGISIQNQGNADGHPGNIAYPFYIKY